MASLSSPTYWDFDQFQEVRINTGGADVRNQTPGAAVDVVLKSGTNQYHGSLRGLLRQRGIPAQQSVRRAGRVESAARRRRGNRMEQYADYGFEVGGPLVRDRLWAWGSARRDRHPSAHAHRHRRPHHADQPGAQGAGAGHRRPAPRVQPLQRREDQAGTQRRADATGRDDLEPGGQRGRPCLPARPPGPGATWSSPPRRPSTTGASSSRRAAVSTRTSTATSTVSTTTPIWTSARGGPSRCSTSTPTTSAATTSCGSASTGGGTGSGRDTVWPGSGTLSIHLPSYPDNGLMLPIIFGDSVVNGEGRYLSFYASDRISLDRLTVDVGLRFDRSAASLAAGEPAGEPAGAGRAARPDFRPSEQHARLRHRRPRASGVELRARRGSPTRSCAPATGSSPSQLPAGASGIPRGTGRTTRPSTTWPSISNGDGVTQRDELLLDNGIVFADGFDPANPTSTESVNQVASDLSSPRTHELIFGLDRELPIPNSALTASVTWRRVHQLHVDGRSSGSPPPTTAWWTPSARCCLTPPRRRGSVSQDVYAPLPGVALPPGGGREERNREGLSPGLLGLGDQLHQTAEQPLDGPHRLLLQRSSGVLHGSGVGHRRSDAHAHEPEAERRPGHHQRGRQREVGLLLREPAGSSSSPTGCTRRRSASTSPPTC